MYENYNNISGYNPLFFAVHKGETELLPSLIKKYSTTEKVQGKTLINVAAARGHAEIVRMLITKDTDVNTLLNIAIMKNQPSVFHLLIKEYNVNAKNCHDKTPLHYAVMYNRVEFAKILIENSASVEVPYSKRKTPLYYALKEENVELADILFRNGAVLSEFEYNSLRPLQTAAWNGNLEMVKLLMMNGWNTIDCPNNNWAPLYSAVERGHLKLVEYMMENGLIIDTTITEDSLELFHVCFTEDMLNMLKYLINIGVKTKKQFLDDLMCLKRLKMWQYLLTCRSKIDANTYSSETELHSVVREGELETVKKFVNQEADTVKTDSLACKLAVYIAVENSNEEILQVLLNAGYSVKPCFNDISPLHLAATFENTKLVKMLLNAGACVNSETASGFTPLHFAATAGRSTVVKVLLESGADPSKPSNKCGSPLSVALSMNSYGQQRTPITPLMFMNLEKITKMLVMRQKEKDIKELLLHAIRIKVNSEFDEFRPGIVQCILNYQSDDEIKFYLKLLVEEGFNLDYSPELLHVLMEYDNSKSCYSIEVWRHAWEDDLKCLLLLIDYSRNVNNLIRVPIVNSSSNFESEEDIFEKTVLLNLIARLVLLTTSRDLRVLKFCLEHKLLIRYKECLMQKESMLRTPIDDNFNVTFYDVLTESVDKVANYVRNENFRKIIESSYEKFPAFSDFLKIRIDKGIRRKDLREECTNAMYTLIKINHKIQFSNADLDQIFRYLSVVDLRRFFEAFS